MYRPLPLEGLPEGLPDGLVDSETAERFAKLNVKPEKFEEARVFAERGDVGVGERADVCAAGLVVEEEKAVLRRRREVRGWSGW